MLRFAKFITKYRLAVIISSALLTLLFGFYATRLSINSDFTSYLPKDDEKVALFNAADSLYASGNIVIVAVGDTLQSIISPEGIGIIQEITDKTTDIEGVEKVTSLANVIDIKHNEYGIEIGRLLDEEETDVSSKTLEKYILEKEMYKGKLLSEDARYSAVLIFIRPDADKEETAKEIVEVLDKQPLNGNITLHYDGLPIQQLQLSQSTQNDMERLVPIVCALIALILVFSLRTLRGVLLPLMSVLLGSVWCLGSMALFEVKLSPISGSIPVVLFAIGTAYTIHLLNFFKILENGENHKDLVKKGVVAVGVPVMLAGITTIVGFLSFIPGTYLSIIRDFGVFMALGTAFCLAISLTLVPATESYLKPLRISTKNKSDIFEKILLRIGSFSTKNTKLVLLCTLAIVGAMSIGIFKIKSNIDVLFYFPEKHTLRQSADVLNREFGGTLPIQILVEGDLTRPETLRAIEKFEEFLVTLPGVQNPQSIAELIKEMNFAMDGTRQIPNTQEKITNLWFLLEGESVMEQLCVADRTAGIIHATMQNVPTETYHLINREIEIYANENSNTTVNFKTTGLPSIYSNFDTNLMQNLYWSLVIACVLVFVSMVFLVKSVKGALVGFAPLVITIIFIFGLMGYSQIPLDLATVLIAGVAIGIGVDYSIHLIARYRKALAATQSAEDAAKQALLTSGRGILFNVISVAFGFLVLVFAELVPLRQFGFLMFTTMLVAGVAAMIVLPAIIQFFNINLNKTKKQ